MGLLQAHNNCFSVFGFKTSRKLKQLETVEMVVKNQLKEN